MDYAMLEIKNLKKTYVPKKGVPVVALDNVSIKIEDKGLVFILGKSGSGKSTLLNLLGGLDKYDEGDIIIKGKSTKDFTQGDFDSYRNTYVGFIFQEYNILNEFSVGANIALAIELQGRKATNEEVNKILETLDLVGYGNRRPNELSGGQKQRIAIARALVKNPDIILADEPTGALDSKTGQQIFDILKKLSKEKLVLVVSHDREFAEEFGDRVIELADGKIISDISKTTITNGDADSPNLQYVEKEGLVVREGYKLTAEDLEMINRYLEKVKNLNIISKNAEEFRTRSVFVETKNDLSLKTYSDAFTMIKSKLPFKMAFRMGASGLRHKKVRLFFTILLSLVAFTLFGITDSLAAYNKIDATANSIIDSRIEAAALAKTKTFIVNDYEQTFALNLSDDDISKLNDGIGKELGISFKPVYTGSSGQYEGAFRIDQNFSPTTIRGYDMYYLDTISGFVEYSKAELEEMGFTVYGEMPDEDDEIAIPDYIFEHFKTKGYGRDSIDIKPDNIHNYFDIIGKTITLRNYRLNDALNFEVTAIIDTNLDSSRYEKLKDPDDNFSNYYLAEEFRTMIQYGFHGLGYVNSGLIERLIDINSSSNLYVYDNAYLSYRTPSNDLYISGEYVDKLASYQNDEIIFFDKDKTTLGQNEILVDSSTFMGYYQNEITYEENTGAIYSFYDTFREKMIREYVEEHYLEAQANNFFTDQFGETGNDRSEQEKINTYFSYLVGDGYYENPYGDKSGRELEDDSFIYMAPIYQQIPEIPIQKEYQEYITYTQDFTEAKVVGVYHQKNSTSPNAIIIDDEFYSEIESIAVQGPYKFALAKMPSERSKVVRLADFSYQINDQITYPLKNSTSPMLETANTLVEEVAQVFLYIGLAFAVFSALMLSNFIASSVSVKKREIGILRAIGARSNDVFRIFFNESIIIAIINFFLASIATFIAVRVINDSLRSGVGLTVTIFYFSIRQVALLLAISVFVAIAASFLPVYRIARKKPVDAISNR
jgi:putative ABC transport system permease protein